jgi:nitrate reductase alpha subunit
MSASKHLPVKTKLLVDNISSPWEARTGFDAFSMIAAEFSRLAAAHLGTRTDVIAAPLMHDTSDELAQPGAIDDEGSG